jgi:serine/threonine protein kinase
MHGSELLGSGNFCDVFSGKYDGHTVAIKMSHEAANKEMKTEKQVEQEFFAREALIQEGRLMAKIRHPNVITFIALVLWTVFR